MGFKMSGISDRLPVLGCYIFAPASLPAQPPFTFHFSTPLYVKKEREWACGGRTETSRPMKDFLSTIRF